MPVPVHYLPYILHSNLSPILLLIKIFFDCFLFWFYKPTRFLQIGTESIGVLNSAKCNNQRVCLWCRLPLIQHQTLSHLEMVSRLVHGFSYEFRNIQYNSKLHAILNSSSIIYFLTISSLEHFNLCHQYITIISYLPPHFFWHLHISLG